MEPATGTVCNIAATGVRKRGLMGVWLSVPAAAAWLWILVERPRWEWILLAAPMTWMALLCLRQAQEGT